MLGSNPGDRVLVHKRIFADIRLFVPKEYIRISVYEGVKGDYFEEERMQACSITENQCRNPQADGLSSVRNQTLPMARTHYTYVALYLRGAQFRIVGKENQKSPERFATVRWIHHVTLAYLPLITQREMRAMEAALNELIAEWLVIEPKLRPVSLLTSRGLVEGRRAEDFGKDDMLLEVDRWRDTDIYTWNHSDFINMEWEQLCKLIDNGLLLFAHEPKEITNIRETRGNDQVTPEVMKAVCKKYYDRDVNRYRKARAMEDEIRPKYALQGMIEVLLRGSKVHRTSELKSLLYYLREMLVFKYGVHHMHPPEDLGLHNEESWHVTPQTNGTPEHADYVEGFLDSA